MNRIILIGNGFDLAHGLKTGYRDFMDSYWKNTLEKMRGEHSFEDEFVKIMIGFHPQLNSYNELKKYAAKYSNNGYTSRANPLKFKNEFWKQISEKTYLQSWLDIENEYYKLLKDFLKESRRYAGLWPAVKDLNDEFCQVKNLLEKYLTEIWNAHHAKHESIREAIVQPVKVCDIAKSRPKREMLIRKLCVNQILMSNYPDLMVKRLTTESDSHLNNLRIGTTIFLNFNYTNTAKKLYALSDDAVINIHGELNNPANPIIFGYGDELDDDYREIEKTNDNDFLDNIKSIQYHNTGNYRNLLSFLEDEPYQVFIMGHSCGNSDRTLLNTIFEHENCISIKPFFYQWRDETSGEIKDNYTELTKNISRNFNDKQKMRDVVVNREYCLPLVPCKEGEKAPTDA